LFGVEPMRDGDSHLAIGSPARAMAAAGGRREATTRRTTSSASAVSAATAGSGA